MNNNDFIARHIADTAGVTPQQVYDSGQLASGETQVRRVEDEGTPFLPADLAVEQGQKAIVANVQMKEAEEARVQEQGRMAQAIAEHLAPKVTTGKIRHEDVPVATLLPAEGNTMPEPREAIQAGISNVGVGGRKAVFSEIAFDADDVPEGWDVWRTEDGGWLTAPEENTDEVMVNEREGKRHESLGMLDEKKESHEGVVQIKDVNGVAFHEETTDKQGLESIISNAINIADEIKGSVDIKSPQEVLNVREAKATPKPVLHGGAIAIDPGNVLRDIGDITRFEEHPEGYVSPLTALPDGTVGRAQANRDGMAYPYMFHVKGKGWEVDVGYGGLIESGLTEERARELVQTIPPIPIEEARKRSEDHINRDLIYVQGKYPSLSPAKQGLLAMMRYQGGDGLDVSKWKNTNAFLKAAIASNKATDWKRVQRAMLNSKWATLQTPERALRLIQAMHPATPMKELARLQRSLINARQKKAPATILATLGVRG